MATRIVSAKAFGTAIRDERKRRSLSQENLGKLVGVDQTTVSYIENGKPGVRLSTILLLLSALELDLVIEKRTTPEENSPKDSW